MKKTIISLSIILFVAVSTYAQSINIDSIKINNKIPLSIDFNKLKKLNLIDSITPIPQLMDMSNADSLVFIGNTYFEYYKRTNSCNVAVIVFDNKVKTVSINGTKLGKFTTFEEIKKMFPNDCSKLDPIKIYGDKTEYMTCAVGLKTPNGVDIDMRLLFFFSKNKLKRIDLWEPD